MKTQLEQGNTIITVNCLVWMGLPDHEGVLWGRLGDIEKVNSTSPRLIEIVIPEAQKAIEGDEIEFAEEMDQIMFYSKALGLFFWIRDGHSGQNWARNMVRQLVKDKIKAVHPFPYVDKCLPIADWNDPMWNTEGFNPSISPDVKKH